MEAMIAGNAETGKENCPLRRILVIDDEQPAANNIRILLSSQHYEVYVAYSGRDGIRKISEMNPDLVITDLRMNDVDGFDVMRALANFPNVPFIVITGHATTESAIEAIHHKAFDFITKPFDFDVLLASVERAFERIESNRFRNDMISMITHDIKIPLSSIIGYSSLVFDRHTGEMNPRAREFVQVIGSNGQKILALIDNFLTSCKIEAGKLSIVMRDVDVNFILEDMLDVFEVEIARNQLKLNTELHSDLPHVQGDENLLFRALSNMMSNACKFTQRDGEIHLRTSVVEANASPIGRRSIRIEVSNTGSGIPSEELETVFDKFSRGTAHEGIEGTGIGLYVLRYVIEAHGGCVSVASTPNSLTTFSAFLPTGESNPRQEAPAI
jgi:two-component system, sensor histidine kinase and response regulator